jgi:FlaA1/EpsC-like NDP-sugar epimerase
MGEPVRIADLARELIRPCPGYTESEIPIVYTCLRLGEKLYEEPLADNENTLPTPHPMLRVAQRGTKTPSGLRAQPLAGNECGTDDAAVGAALARRVPEYAPQTMHGA